MTNKQVCFIYLISTRTASKQKLINLSVIQNRHDRSMTRSVYECVPIQIRIRSQYQVYKKVRKQLPSKTSPLEI